MRSDPTRRSASRPRAVVVALMAALGVAALGGIALVWPDLRAQVAGAPATDLAATPALAAALAALAAVDLAERRLPDRLTLPLAAAGLVLGGLREGGLPWAEATGAAAGFAAFWALGEAHHRARGVEGLGLGDAKLLAAAGAWLGWRALPPLVLLAALAALAAVALGRPARRDLAFGPWLAAALMAFWLARLTGTGAETFGWTLP